MTLTLCLKLCQRRRPMVDPIPAFLHQLSKYEKECRTMGYLTAVDDTVENNDAGKKVAEAHDNESDNTCDSTAGEKRKANSSGSSDSGKKQKAAGPMIGPSSCTMPSKGPGRSAVIGPARGPPSNENNC